MIIQTILLDPSGAVWTDDPYNGSRLDPSGADWSTPSIRLVIGCLLFRVAVVPVAVHQPSPRWSSWYRLDLPLDLSSTNGTQDYPVDVDHQPTDLTVDSSRFLHASLSS